MMTMMMMMDGGMEMILGGMPDVYYADLEKASQPTLDKQLTFFMDILPWAEEIVWEQDEVGTEMSKKDWKTFLKLWDEFLDMLHEMEEGLLDLWEKRQEQLESKA